MDRGDHEVHEDHWAYDEQAVHLWEAVLVSCDSSEEVPSLCASEEAQVLHEVWEVVVALCDDVAVVAHYDSTCKENRSTFHRGGDNNTQKSLPP